jgi:hypothetical protein
MAAPLNDVAMAVFTTLALVAWQESCRVGTAHQNANRPETFLGAVSSSPSSAIQRRFWWAVPTQIAGRIARAAQSMKYVALVFAAAVGATWFVILLTSPGRRRSLLRSASIVAAVAVLVSGVWYARAAYYRGNPVYPFFAGIVGAEGPPTVRESKTPLKWTAADMLAAPWRVTMRPEAFGGRGHQLGGLFL